MSTMVSMTSYHTTADQFPAISTGPTAGATASTVTGFHPIRAVRSLSASLASSIERRRVAAHWSRSHRSRRNRPPTRHHLRAQWEAEFRGF